jgi:peptidoglycan/LPS O-acetylase OafA/YrhL
MPALLDRPRILRRSDGIDSLRAALALWVLFSHLATWGPLSETGSWGALERLEGYGVDAFQGRGETHPAVVAFIVLSGTASIATAFAAAAGAARHI